MFNINKRLKNIFENDSKIVENFLSKIPKVVQFRPYFIDGGWISVKPFSIPAKLAILRAF